MTRGQYGVCFTVPVVMAGLVVLWTGAAATMVLGLVREEADVRSVATFLAIAAGTWTVAWLLARHDAVVRKAYELGVAAGERAAVVEMAERRV